MNISNPGGRKAPVVVDFGAFYSALIMAVSTNLIYELASLFLPRGTDLL